MATFSKMDTPVDSFKNITFYKVNGKISEDDVRQINSLHSKTILVLSNTKGQSSSIIRSIKNPNVEFSVVGGLDYLKKNKFKKRHYIERTLYSPNVLASVIKVFEEIERHIRYTWTDRQKCMYVYNVLVEQLHYKYDNESDYENGRDVVRSLEGLLYRKLVCSGFALVFKEAMDRLGIPCIYQNRRGHHSWNIVEIDGKKYGMELTWDCSIKKQDNLWHFYYFGQDEDFYSNEHHNISDDPEEKRENLSTFSIVDLRSDYSIIKGFGNIQIVEMKVLNESNPRICIYPINNGSKGIFPYLLATDKNHMIIYSSKTIDNISYVDVYDAINNYDHNLDLYLKNGNRRIESYSRDDGTRFHICKSRKASDNIDEYLLYDFKNKDGKTYLRRAVILSEMDLTHPVDLRQKQQIANNLLSHERLKRKINSNHGYVGYLVGRQAYFDRKFEEEKLHVAIHK